MLWLVGEGPDEREASAAELTTTLPPVCVPCAVTAVRSCPHLRMRYVALRVGLVTVAGVRGELYRPGGLFPEAYDADGVAWDDWRVRWILAAQLVIELHHFTVADLEDLAEGCAAA
ncbi:hypothetical protein [Streptomyces sp. NPDC059743]|uniref:hypothetical protein n=1 Tax=Streptomyces sp. NPDC059743 TaxID=3346928 RepID=UPI0036628649